MMEAPVVARFYEAFARRDATTMAACYHPEATFEDPVFGPLDREAACAMWAMLLSRSADLTITHTIPAAEGPLRTALWEAQYTFSRTGRPVHNRITATITLQDGLIRTHRDRFSFWAWARQAFGPLGLLVGWTPWFQSTVQRDAHRVLAHYRAKRT